MNCKLLNITACVICRDEPHFSRLVGNICWLKQIDSLYITSMNLELITNRKAWFIGWVKDKWNLETRYYFNALVDYKYPELKKLLVLL